MLNFPYAIPNVDFGQLHLIKKMNEWLAMHGKAERLEESGYCSGFGLLWGAAKVQGKSQAYFDLLCTISTISPENELSDQQDEDIEEFIQALMFSQEPKNAVQMEEVEQAHYESIAEIVLSTDNPIREKEFSIDMVLTLPELESVLKKVVIAENKLIRLDSIAHATTLVYQNGKYYFYDPNFYEGEMELNNIKDLAKMIQKQLLTVFNRPDENISLSLHIFDVVGTPPVHYQDSVELMEEIFAERKNNAKPVHPSIWKEERDQLWVVARRGTPEQIEAVIKADPLNHDNRLKGAPGDESVQMGDILSMMVEREQPEECFLVLYPEYKETLDKIYQCYHNMQNIRMKINVIRGHVDLLEEITRKINHHSGGKVKITFDKIQSVLKKQITDLEEREKALREAGEKALREAREEEARQETVRLQALKAQQEEADRRFVEVLERQAHQEALRQEALHQEAARQEALRQEAARQEALRREVVRQEAARQEAARQEAARQEAARQEAARQEAARQEAARQEAARQEAARQEAARQEAARQAREQEAHQEIVRLQALKAQQEEADRRFVEALVHQEAAHQVARRLEEATRQEAMRLQALVDQEEADRRFAEGLVRQERARRVRY